MRVIGLDVHRSMAVVAILENGHLSSGGRVDLTRDAVIAFGRKLRSDDEVVIEATVNTATIVRLLRPFVRRVVIANPLQVRAIAHAKIKTDKIDATVLAKLHASGFLPEVWMPDEATETLRRLVAQRAQVVQQMTRIKNRVHSVLHANLIPPFPGELFSVTGRKWLEAQPVAADERLAIRRHLADLDRRASDLAALDQALAQRALQDARVQRLMTISGVHVTVAVGLLAAIGDISRFASPEKLVSYLGLNPSVRQSGNGPAHHGRITKQGRAHARGHAGRSSLGRGARTRAAACVLRADPEPTRQAGRRRGHGPQNRGFGLASAEQGRGLRLGASGLAASEASKNGTARRSAGGEGAQTGPRACLQQPRCAGERTSMARANGAGLYSLRRQLADQARRVHGRRKRETLVIRHAAGSHPDTRSSPRGRPCDKKISMAREKALVEDIREVF